MSEFKGYQVQYTSPITQLEASSPIKFGNLVYNDLKTLYKYHPELKGVTLGAVHSTDADTALQQGYITPYQYNQAYEDYLTNLSDKNPITPKESSTKKKTPTQILNEKVSLASDTMLPDDVQLYRAMPANNDTNLENYNKEWTNRTWARRPIVGDNWFDRALDQWRRGMEENPGLELYSFNPVIAGIDLLADARSKEGLTFENVGDFAALLRIPGARALTNYIAKGVGKALTPSTYTNLVSKSVGLGPKATRAIGLTADAAAGGYFGYEGAKDIYQGIQNNNATQILLGAGELAGGGLYAGPGMRTLGIALKNIPSAASGFMKATAPTMKATSNALLGLTSKYPRIITTGVALGAPMAASANEGIGGSGGVNLWPFVIGGATIGGLYKFRKGLSMKEKPIQEKLELPKEIDIASPSVNEVMARPSFRMDIGAEYRKLLEPKIGKAPTRPNYEQVPGPYQRKNFVATEPVTYSLNTTPKGRTKITFSEGKSAYIPSGVSDPNAYAQNIANKRTTARIKKAQIDFNKAEDAAEIAHNKKIQEIIDRNTKTREDFQKALEPYVKGIKRVQQDNPTLLKEARKIVSKKAEEQALKEWELDPEYKQKHAEFEEQVKKINKQNEAIEKSNEAAQKHNAKIPERKEKLNKWLDRIITLGVFGAGGTGIGLAWNALFGSSRTPNGANNSNEVELTFNNNPADTNITSELTNKVEDLFQKRNDEINKYRRDSLKQYDDDD